MSVPVYVKDPDANLDYGFDWSDWLATAETISSVFWTVPTGITNTDEDFTDTTASIWLSSGTVGTSYSVACKITTSAGRVDERTMTIRVKQR